MANVNFSRIDFEKEIKLTPQITEEITQFGTPLESIDNENIEIEIFPNRPDLLSLQGYLRGFKAFLNKSPGLKKYKINPPENNYKVKISSSVKSIRPFTTCAIIKNLKLNDSKIKEIIDLQEKLHSTLGRNRKKVAIGIYPLEKINLPITFEARLPQDIKFTPIESNEEMTARQIISRHPIGIRYSNLLTNYESFPVFLDSKDNILSMPPIINSHKTGKITVGTKSIFIECSGHSLDILNKTLNIIVTTLADQGGSIYQMQLDYDKNIIVTPNLSPSKMNISLDNTNKLLGLDLKDSDLQKLLPKMGYDYKNNSVSIPSWRTDILHEVDLIEDIAIAYGYNSLIPEMPQISTIGEQSPESKFITNLSNLIVGLKFNEISTYHLIKKKESIGKKIEVKDSKTDYKILRPNLLIPALRILSENKDNEYPQNIFEIGTVFSRDNNEESETGILESNHLLILSSPGNFTSMKQILDYISNSLSISFTLEEDSHPYLIDGRTASIHIENNKIGHLGELHPDKLKSWNIKMPASIIEISLEKIFKLIQPK